MADPTTYVILRQPPDVADTWHVETSVTATSANGAIRLAAAGLRCPDGAYVAVPAHSWRPLTVTAVQQTTLKIEESGSPETTS